MHFHAARQAVGNLGQRQDVGRAGQQKPAGAAILVDGHLERQQQPGCALYLVDDGPVQSAHQTHGVVQRGVQDGRIVHGEIGSALRELLDQRGLAALPGTIDGHSRGVPQGDAHGACPVAGEQTAWRGWQEALDDGPSNEAISMRPIQHR